MKLKPLHLFFQQESEVFVQTNHKVRDVNWTLKYHKSVLVKIS